MRRIFPASAYGNGPLKGCHWATTVPDDAFDCPPLMGQARADIVIIGAGFTGLSAALHLAQDGVDVAVLEAEFPGWGASGRNGGFCCLGGSRADNALLTRRFGAAGRKAWHQTELAAVDLVRDLLDAHKIDADSHSKGETVMAHSRRAMRDLQVHGAEIETDYGVTPTLHSASDLPALGLNGPFHGALTIPVGFGLNPRKYLAGLMHAAQSAGARIHAYSPATAIISDATGHRVTTPQGQIAARRLIFATNGYSSEDLPPWMAARYMPAQSNVLVTRPLTQIELEAAGWTSPQMAYDTRNLLHYFRLMPDNRFLFGMRGGLFSGPKADARMIHSTRAHFEAMFPAWAHVETPSNWSGMVCLAASRLPYVGPVPDMPNAFTGFAYHGNGVAMGSYTGALLADLVQDKPTRLLHPKSMQATPPRFPLGRFRRLLMGALYAHAGLRDL